MSDRPDKTLGMRKRWQAFANAAAKDAYETAEGCQLLGRALGKPVPVVQARLERMLHAQEWTEFVHSLGAHSFVAHWAQTAA